MKKLIVILLIPFNAFLQNLVQNFGFEDYDSCPNMTILGQLFDYVPFWTNLSSSTSYCNRCSTDNFGVPFNLFVNSYQETHSGDAYAVITATNNFGSEIRDYLQNELSQTLQVGTCYYVEYYTSLLNNVRYATNNLGLYFTVDSNLTTDIGYVLNGNPQIFKFGNPIISDTMNWVKVAGIYEAQGGEQYLTIGNFSRDQETDTMVIDPNAYDAAFYYIDDVSVTPINPSLMPANAGVDQNIYIGDSVFIGQEITNLNGTWRLLDGTLIASNTSGVYVSPTDTTTYVVEQNLCGTISYDTVTVNTLLKTPLISANPSLNFCSGESVVLTVDASSGIVWSPTGETTPSITVSSSGTYFVTHTFNDYVAVSPSVTTNLTVTPQPTLSSFPEMCDTNATFTFTQGSPTGGVYSVNGIPSTTFDPNTSLIGDNIIEYALANGNCIGTASTILTVVGCTVGLDETLTSRTSVSISPNPNNGIFTIELNKTIAVQELKLLDELGRTVKVLEPKSNKFELNLPKGLYFLEFSSKDAKFLEKIVVH